MSEPFEVDFNASREHITALDTPQTLYLYVQLLAPQDIHQSNLPLNLAIVIDRSTSMKGARLNQVKAAAQFVVEKMSADDVLTIISYSDRAEVVSPAAKLHDKAALKGRIRTILASGGTEIFQGLSAAWKELRRHPLDQHVNHLILLTDGHTYGDDQQCLELAEAIAAQGTGLSAFGIGSEWNDDFLDSLVTPSGGQSAYISHPEQIIHLLRQRIKELGAIHAQNVRLQLDLPDGVQLKEAFKLLPFAQPLKYEKRELKLGALEGRAPLAVLLELRVDPQELGRKVVIPFALRGNLPDEEQTTFVIKRGINLPVTDIPNDGQLPEGIVHAVQILNLYRMHESAWHDMEKGNVLAATKRMEHLTARLREAGFTQLAQHAQAETQRISYTGKLSSEGRKRLKYGTRTLMTQSLGFSELVDDTLVTRE